MIEILLHGLKMDPLVSLHYYAPVSLFTLRLNLDQRVILYRKVCALINLAILPFTEGLEPFYEVYKLVGPFIMVTNAAVAFCLNIAAVYLVSAGSGLVLTLAGVLKVCAFSMLD